jgi:peptidoglycan DL-endopeptidase CwlO
MASSAPAAPAAQITLVSASAPTGEAQLPSSHGYPAAIRAADYTNRYNRAAEAAVRVTNAAVWSDKASVMPGATVHLTSQVTYGAQPWQVVSQPVYLQVKSGNAWRDVSALVTSANGYAVFTVKPTRSSTYRVSYRAAGTLAASISEARTVTVTSPPPVTTATPSASTASTSAPVAAASGRGAQVAAAAAAQSGKPYSYGAAGPGSFDCSGLTLYAYKTVGISLPHNADAQKSYGTAVSRANARPGDLIIFMSGGYGYHAAIYAGGGYMYDAPNPGTTVGKHKIYSGTVIFRRLV